MSGKGIRIVSDGTPSGTQVLTADGAPIKGILSISIDEINPQDPVRATIVVIVQSLEVEAHAIIEPHATSPT